MTDSVKSIIASINKKFGEDTLTFGSDSKYSSISRLPSGSLFLDYTLGTNKQDNIAGWPMGRIIELYGPESSGKSLISLKTIVEAQKKGFLCVYIDSENSFDEVFAETLGVDLSKLILIHELVAERVFDIACDILKNSKDVRVIVFDSIASMIPTAEIEASLEDKQMAEMARVMSKALRKLTLFNKNNTVLIFINQLRENPGAGMYANPIYTPGGKALKFYASIRAEIRRGEWIFADENKKEKVGQVVKFKIDKNKTDVAQKEGYFKFMYKDGKLDTIDELVSLGILRNVIDRKGAYYSLLDKTFQGRDEMEKELLNNKEFFEEAKKEVFSA